MRARAARDFGEFVAMRAERIEQGELLATLQQGLVLVLAMDLEQARGERAQLADSDRAAIDPRARTAFAADHPAQLAGTVLVEFLGNEPFAQVRVQRQVERGSEFGAFATVAHHRRLGAAAGEQQQGIDQQRLAGAGLAGDHGHARAECDLGLADDREILDVETFQHAGGPLPG